MSSGCLHGQGHGWFDVSGTLCVLGDSSAVLTSISLPGAGFWEGLSGFHTKVCFMVAFLDLQVGFDAKQRGSWQKHRILPGSR